MMRLRQLTWVNEYLRRRSDKLVYSLAWLRPEEAMVDMEFGEAKHDFCSGLRVGNSRAKNRVMPQEESLTGMEESLIGMKESLTGMKEECVADMGVEYGQTEMDITMCA